MTCLLLLGGLLCAGYLAFIKRDKTLFRKYKLPGSRLQHVLENGTLASMRSWVLPSQLKTSRGRKRRKCKTYVIKWQKADPYTSKKGWIPGNMQNSWH